MVIPAPSMTLSENGSTAKIVLAGGCFWGVQGVFQRVDGVKNAVSGYAGGDASTASYNLVTSGTTVVANPIPLTNARCAIKNNAPIGSVNSTDAASSKCVSLE